MSVKYENLIRLRESLNMTQTAFAQSLGINTTTYNNYESGLRDPKSDFWKLVSKKYDVSIDFLLGLTNFPRKPSKGLTLNFSEEEHIKNYRDLDDHGKKLVDALIKMELERVKSSPDPAGEEQDFYVPYAAFGGKTSDEMEKKLQEVERRRWANDPSFFHDPDYDGDDEE